MRWMPAHLSKDHYTSRRGLLLIVLGLLLYALFRIATLPSNPADTQGFTHDGAYLSIAARNLHEGKGYVLDALWPVFAQRGSLPMPCENANPLYPVLMAIAMSLWSIGAPQAGFLISALSSVALIVAVLFMVRPYVGNLYAAMAIGCIVAFFPPVWDSSWTVGPDEMWIAFMVAFVAALVRSDRLSNAALAGLFFGLAWLTRSAATTVLPGLGIWVLFTQGWRKAVPRMALFGLIAAAVATPWLIYSAKLWGSPLHSNTGSMMSAHVDSWKYGNEVTRAFHSPVAAAPYIEVFKQDPVRFVSHCLGGAVAATRELFRSTQGSMGVAVLPTAGRALSLGILLALGIVAVIYRPRVWRSPAMISVIVFSAIFVAFLSMGGVWAEGRYFLMIHVLFVAWLCVTLWDIWREYRGGGRPPLYTTALAAAALYAAVLLPMSDYRDARYQRSPNPERVEYARTVKNLDDTLLHGSPVIVGNYPFYYSFATKAQALAIPSSTDEYLLDFMDQYHADHVILSTSEQAFWRPTWTAGMLPVGLQVLGVGSRGYYIYKRIRTR
jgi:hypothetical protein